MIEQDFNYIKNITLPPLPTRFLQVDFLDLKNEKESLEKEIHAQSKIQQPFAISQVYQMKIKDAKVLVSGESDHKKVVEITLDASNTYADSLPGDTIGILPENSDEDVEETLKLLNLLEKSNRKLKVSSISNENSKKIIKIPIHIPLISTPRIILKQCLNLHSIPKKQLIRLLIEYTNDDKEKQFLKVLCSKEGSKLYSDLVTNENLTFIKLLKKFTSCQPDFGVVLEYLPRLLPRPYSIRNDCSLTINENGTTEIKIVFSILNCNPGVTTNYLQKKIKNYLENDKNTNIHINCYFREFNKFRFTKNEIDKNIIMISIGCGISPFLGFMDYKKNFLENEEMNLKTNGKMILISGFRSMNYSLYEKEIEMYLRKGILAENYKSFSKETHYKYKYVQDHIFENAEKLIELIFKENALIYVCADGSNISNDIQMSLQKIIASQMDCNAEEAKEIFLQLKKCGQYREDLWL